MLERYHRGFVRAGRGARRQGAASAWRPSPSGWRRSAPSSARTCWPTSRTSCWCWRREAELAGLPEAVRAAAAQTATERGHKGKHAISLSRSSVEPFLQFSARRDLREQAFKAWRQRGANGGKTDNRKIMAEILELRAERSHLLGFKTPADAALEFTMAKTPANVRKLLMDVWKPAKARAEEERDDLQEAVQAEGGNFKLAGWDWRYYAEKVRKTKFDVDEAEVKPYLQLDSVIAAAFDVASKLFGVSFKERKDLPVYHPDVRAFEVTDADGRHIGLFLGDYFARASKRSGAWMSGWRDQHKLDAQEVRPIVVNVMNFAKGAPGEPSLLSIDDARTLFHEFGHGLHGLLSNVTYPTVSRHQRGAGLRRAALAALRALVDAPAGAEEIRAGTTRPASRCPRRCSPRSRRRAISTRASPRWSTWRRRSSTSTCTCWRTPSELDVDAFEKKTLEKIGTPRGDRHAPSHPALPAHHRRLCGGLLQLHVVGGDGRRRLPRLRGDGRRLRSQARRRSSTTTSIRPAASSDPADAYKAFRGRLPTTQALLEKRGLAGAAA